MRAPCLALVLGLVACASADDTDTGATDDTDSDNAATDDTDDSATDTSADVVNADGNVLNGIFTGGSALVTEINAWAGDEVEAPERVYNGELAGDCSQNWRPQGALCDEEPTTHSLAESTRANSDSGSTWTANTADPTTGVLVIDACSDGSCDVISFHEARVFQMFSDGKLTHIRLSVHPNRTEPAPAWFDGLWTPISDFEEVGPGMHAAPTVTEPTALDLGPQKSRYIRVETRNDGSHGNPNYIELRALKLFDSL